MPLSMLVALMFTFGILNGLRTLTPVAILCWGAYLGWFSLAHTPFFFLAHPVSLAVFSLLALGEWVSDKLPKTPPRTEPFPLVARIGFAAGCGTVLATLGGIPSGSGSLGQSSASGFLLGIVVGGAGGYLGTYGAFVLRRALTHSLPFPDFPVALAEDAVALGGALFVASRF